MDHTIEDAETARVIYGRSVFETVAHRQMQGMLNDFIAQMNDVGRWFAPLPPQTWAQRVRSRLRYQIERRRERLGEIIAGRRFGDDY